MTYSPLTDEKMPPTGRYQGNVKWSARPVGVRINGLNVHHWAGTNMSGLDRLVKSSDPASANYLILNDGRLIGSVPEEFRAWTTSAYANDDDKITVEIQNETGAPSWRISAAAMATLIRLYADLARRYRFAPTRANLRGHKEYGIATACPGPYLLPRLDEVARKAAALGTTTDLPEEPDMDTTQAKQLSESRAILGEIKALLGGRVKAEGTTDGILHDTAHEWEIKILRRVEANQIAQKAIPVDVEVTGTDVAEALLEMLPKATATAVVDAMHARLAK
jgi:hypothetical protein